MILLEVLKSLYVVCDIVSKIFLLEVFPYEQNKQLSVFKTIAKDHQMYQKFPIKSFQFIPA